MPSRWFSRATLDARGLLLPPAPRRHAAALLLGPDHATVRAGETEVELPWDRFGAWTVGSFWAGRGGELGITIVVRDDLAPAAAPLHRALRTWRNRLARPLDALTPELVLPLRVRRRVTCDDHERDTLRALCRFLAATPGARPRLADPDRLRRLRDDLAAGAVRDRAFDGGLRRVTTEVAVALQGLGFTHPLGRPLPWERLEADEVVAEVVARIRRNPYARDVDLPPERVRAAVERVYTRVRPWPFGALEPPRA